MSAPDDGVSQLHPDRTPEVRQRRLLHPVGVLGVAALVGGLLGWLWAGDWRWAVTGLGLMVVLLVTGTTLQDRRGR